MCLFALLFFSLFLFAETSLFFFFLLVLAGRLQDMAELCGERYEELVCWSRKTVLESLKDHGMDIEEK